MFHFNRRTAVALSFAAALFVSGFAATVSAGERLDKIMETKVLRVGTPGDYRPFAILEEGKYSGHDIDMIGKMAEIYKWKIEYVPTSWPTLSKDFAADKFDVALGGLARTPARVQVAEFLPAYAPFGKVALTRKEFKDRFTTVESMNQPDVRVIKNPGGTNEVFVDTFLKNAKVTLHQKNHEIPVLISEGKGDIMITENDEARNYCKKYPNLHAAFMDKPLTPLNFKGFMLQKDDADFVRVMNYLWNLMELRGELSTITAKWLK